MSNKTAWLIFIGTIFVIGLFYNPAFAWLIGIAMYYSRILVIYLLLGGSFKK